MFLAAIKGNCSLKPPHSRPLGFMASLARSSVCLSQSSSSAHLSSHSLPHEMRPYGVHREPASLAGSLNKFAPRMGNYERSSRSPVDGQPGTAVIGQPLCDDINQSVACDKTRTVTRVVACCIPFDSRVSTHSPLSQWKLKWHR